MKCRNHNDADAVGTCKECGVGLCASCVGRYEIPACDNCVRKNNSALSRIIIFKLALVGFAAIAMVIIPFIISLSEEGISEAFQLSLLNLGIIFLPFGFKWVSDNMPFFLVDIRLLFLVLLPLSICFGYLAGWILGPYRIYQMSKELTTVNATKVLYETNDEMHQAA